MKIILGKNWDITYWSFGFGVNWFASESIAFELYLGPLYLSIEFCRS